MAKNRIIGHRFSAVLLGSILMKLTVLSACFAKEQPDLNWESEKLKEELFNMIRWWLDKGIDGFRLDAISHVKKMNIQ